MLLGCIIVFTDALIHRRASVTPTRAHTITLLALSGFYADTSKAGGMLLSFTAHTYCIFVTPSYFETSVSSVYSIIMWSILSSTGLALDPPSSCEHTLWDVTTFPSMLYTKHFCAVSFWNTISVVRCSFHHNWWVFLLFHFHFLPVQPHNHLFLWSGNTYIQICMMYDSKDQLRAQRGMLH